MRGLEAGKPAHQPTGRDRREDAEADALTLACPADTAGSLLDAVEGVVQLLGKCRAEFGQMHLAMLALEERRAEMLFQPGDMAADGAVRAAEITRRGGGTIGAASGLQRAEGIRRRPHPAPRNPPHNFLSL